MNDAPLSPQFPNPNQPTPPAGFELPAPQNEGAGMHLPGQPGTEMMRPPVTEKPTHEQMTRTAIAKLTLGESVVVHLPEGNTKVTYRGVGADGRPIYHNTLISRPDQSLSGQQQSEQAPMSGNDQSTRPALRPLERPVNPYAVDSQNLLPPPAYGPRGGLDFGPQGSGYQAPQRPFVTPLKGGSQPPEAYPDAGPDFADRSEIAAKDIYYNPEKWSAPESETVDGDPAVPPNRQIVEEQTPPVEKIRPESVQTEPDGTAGAEDNKTVEVERDLVDQLSDGTAPPVAEMRPEDREDMSAVRHPGAKAAAEKAEATKTPDDETPVIEGVGGTAEVSGNKEGDITQILPEGVVPEGERPPDTDFTPGGGRPRLYRR